MNNTTKLAQNLRKNQTEAEKKLWYKLRNRQLNGYKFRRQHPFPPYILDFYCEDLGLVIELDGGQHSENKDQKRTSFLNQKGLTVLRYWNNKVLTNMDGVLEDITTKADTPSSQGKNNQRLCIAKIATAHGIKGLVKLHVFTDDPQLANGPLFTSESGDKSLSFSLKNKTAKHWLAEIKGITDRTEAEKLRGTELYIDKAALPETNSDEFYIDNLIGLPCFDKETQSIGKVIAVENFGASDLLEIQPAGAESFYLPFTDDTILDILEDKIIVEIPEGLLG